MQLSGRRSQSTIFAYVHLALEILPFLETMESKPTKSTTTYTGSNISISPAMTLSACSASKAALNSLVLCLRHELAHAKCAVEINEISPPVVQTELRDHLGPSSMQTGMPVKEFIDGACKGLVSGSNHVVIGDVGGAGKVNNIVDERRAVFKSLAKILRCRVYSSARFQSASRVLTALTKLSRVSQLW